MKDFLSTFNLTKSAQRVLSLCCFFVFSAFYNTNAQSVTIEKASASGCYYYNGASKTTISIQVGWTGATNGELITVTLDGSSTRTFSPQAYYDPGLTTNNSQKVAGPIVTPQVVAFEINSDGASHTIQAVLSNLGTTLATSTLVNVSAPQPCVPLVCNGSSLGGVAYYDNNANGIRDPGEIKMIAGVVVTAFDKLSNKYTTTTDGNGLYSFTSIPTSNYPVRVEFTGWPVNVLSNSGPSSTTTNTSSVQFVTAPSCSINCGAVDPDYYTQANPTVFTNLYTNGDPLAGGNAASMPSIIAHAYNNTNDYTETTIATNAQTGSLWAHAWNKQNKVLFSAAFLKRHAGLGPLGLGGIYKVDYKNPSSPIVSSFLDLTTIGIDLGQSSVPSNSVRGLFAGKTTPNKDLDVFGLVGKVGIGGMTLSADGNTLYFVNLFDKKVYAIDITNYLITGTLPTSSNVTSYAVPDPTCTGGNYRPFAIKIYDGKLYVGVVCDAFISQNKSDLTAHIYSLDLNNTSSGFATVFDFPLTYPKGYPAQNHDTKTGWYPWTDDMSVTWGNNDNTYPQPVLSDIAFDLDGTMAIAFFDRTAHQVGTNNYDDPTFTHLDHENYAGGDILRAYFSNGAYILENAGKSGPYTGAQTNNNQGPGFGEFYSDNMYPYGGFHTEMVTGGLAIKPGSGEVLVGMVDPTSYKIGDIRQNGLRHLGNTTGLTNSSIAYYHTSNTVDEVASFGKGNGMGDIELATDVLSYLEIGNYVWNDANYNGIQDPTETGIAGISMNLYNKNTGALVATEITDANGNYLFSTLKGDNILPNTDYVVVAGVGQYNATTKILTANGKDYAITPAFVGEGSNPTLNDNNFSTTTVTSALGAIPANLPKFDVTTGTVGYVNHSIDLGLTYGTIGNYVWKDTNKDGIQNEPAANGINGVTVNLLKDDGTGNFVVVATTTTADSVAGGRSGYYNFQIAQNGNYKVQFPAILNGSDSLTTQDATAATDFNSDADRTSGFSPAFTMDVTSTGVAKNNPTIDAGYYTPVGSLGNYVWYDDNNDGINNEPTTNGINGVTVELYKKNSSNVYALFATTITADSLAATGGTSNPGYYNFPNLLAGDYKVKFPTSVGAFPLSDVNNQLPQADYNNDADKATGYSGVVTINPISANSLDQNNPTIDAGYKTNIGSLGNYVWFDANGNGLQDEPAANGINGVKVYLYKSIAGVFTKVDSTITANNGANPGYYNFPNLGSGNYQVEFPLVTSAGSLTIANQTAKTDGNSDADLTTGKSATVVINTQSTDALDVNNPTIDAGYRPVGSLGNYVWYDSNNNGIKDEPATNGINGVTVKLLKDDGTGNFVLFATTTTADSLAATGGTSNPGYYNFPNLLAGKYIVQFPTAIGNYPISDVTNQAPQADYNNDADKATGYSGVVTIDVFGSGLDKDNPTIDAGYKTNIGSLGNYVWTDTNGDGIQNESTTNGINGVKVYLLQETTPGVYTKVDSTVTANKSGNPGYYNFPNLNSGNYKVQFPTTIYGSPLTKQTVTPQTDLNSDADSATGISPIVAINTSSSNPLDVNNPTIDAGYKYSVAPNCNMTASITVNQIAQCVTSNQYQFTGNFTGGTGPYTFFWDLNDSTYAYTKDVTHTYATAGEHDVTLIVKDSRGCEAHASTVQIYIGAKPIAAFVVYGNSGNGSGVSFNSTSTISGGWMTYKWDLGNGTTSTLSNPGPIYYAPGTYTVTLIATGNFGCSDTVTKTIVVPNPGSYCTAPTAAFNINNATQCINGNAFAFTNASINGSTYKWTFGDGSATVTTSSANYTYASAGTYTVTLISTNTCGSDTITKTVVVKPLPATPAAISGVTTVKAGDVITLSSSSTGGVWSSSNPAVATVNAYGFVYGLTAGTTTISYTLSNDCGAVSATYMVTVIGSIVVPPVTCVSPTANFTINTANQCLASNAYTFSNNTTGTSPTYAWDFGDGSTASTTNATHTYAVAGTYNVKLDVTNACGVSSITKTVVISDVPVQPASISGTTSVSVGSTTALSSATAGGVWSSNNTLVATVDPTTGLVTGISNGSATITYKISNACGFASRSVTVIISTPATPPCPLPATPAVITGTTTLTVGATTTLSSATVGGVWSSNNTGVATINPSTGLVTAVGTGTASISYTVSNACGFASVNTLVTVNTACITPVANFTVNNATQCLNTNSFVFTNTTTGTADTYTWNFGDGSSNVTSPTHTYATAGTYTVTLQASSACGGSSKTITIIVQPGATAPAAIGGTPSVPVGSTTTLTSATVGGSWISSNTAVATVDPATGVVTGVAAGKATITYTVNNGCGAASASLQVTVTVPCGAATTSTLNATICEGTGYSFNGGYYTVAGSYTAHLTNAAGCDSAATLVLTVNPLPTQPTAITGTTSIVVAGTTTLSSTPAGGVWTSANTSVATVNASTGLVTGVASGSVAITYKVSNGCGSKSVSTTVTVGTPVVVVPPTPTCNLAASFTINNNKQCVTDNSFVFTNTTTGGSAPYTYLWDLNDGTYASTKDVTKTYATFGEHDVTLKVTDANGCISNSSAQQLYVGAKPQASFSILTNTGSGSSTTFISSSTIALGTMSYLWDLGNGQTSTSVNPTTNYTPAPATPYIVKLIVSGLGTCKDTAIQSYTQYAIASVSVYPNPVMDVIQVSFRAASATPTTVKIMDLAGRVLQVQTVTPVSSGANVTASLDTRGLQSGSYIVYISDVQNGFIATKAILKQ
jgi:PKD repeat protein